MGARLRTARSSWPTRTIRLRDRVLTPRTALRMPRRDEPGAAGDTIERTEPMADEDERRKAAIGRLQAKRAFQGNLISYLAVNALLIAIWALSGRGYFWPIWVIVFWGLGLAMHAWTVFGRGGITEADIQREMTKGGDDVAT